MDIEGEMKAYVERWAKVEKVIAQERRTASLELRWLQLNSAYGMAKELGFLHEDPSEMEVIKRWAWLKEKAFNQPPKA